MIAIIDYGAGNLRSILNAITKLGYSAKVSKNSNDVLSASVVILPGVGAASDAMRGLKDSGMDKVIRQIISDSHPLFAICVGMQVLFSETEEGGCKCLGIIPGVVRRLPQGVKIPHMGWNQVKTESSTPHFRIHTR